MKLFDNEIRRVNSFIPKDYEEIKSKKGTEESSKGTEDELKFNKSKKAESSKEKAKGIRKKMLGKKRAGKEQQQESLKRQRMEDDKETDKHKEVEEVESIWVLTLEALTEMIRVSWKLVKTKGMVIQGLR
ncbi:hypothetical protein Tco_0852009 [Tanacetum coccineum]